MTEQEPTRRRLIPSIATKPAAAPAPVSAPESIPEEAIRAAALANGFPSSEPAAPAAEPETDRALLKRQRAAVKRDHHLSVRIRREAYAGIYQRANDRDVPVAQIVEEAVAALEELERQRRG